MLHLPGTLTEKFAPNRAKTPIKHVFLIVSWHFLKVQKTHLPGTHTYMGQIGIWKFHTPTWDVPGRCVTTVPPSLSCLLCLRFRFLGTSWTVFVWYLGIWTPARVQRRSIGCKSFHVIKLFTKVWKKFIFASFHVIKPCNKTKRLVIKREDL